MISLWLQKNRIKSLQKAQQQVKSPFSKNTANAAGKFLRKDKKFKSSEKLIEQMNKDLIYAKKGLKTKFVL